MKRAIVAQATLAPTALSELKDWLGITTASEDAALAQQLRAALETCEAFTGTIPLQTECEEILPISTGWQRIEARPVVAISAVQVLDSSGARSTLAPADYALDFRADGSGWLRLNNPGAANRMVVRFTAGLAAQWSGLPDGLRHGVIRLAAHQYRQRESGDHAPTPPAAVAVLWRPWRGVRLL